MSQEPTIEVHRIMWEDKGKGRAVTGLDPAVKVLDRLYASKHAKKYGRGDMAVRPVDDDKNQRKWELDEASTEKSARSVADKQTNEKALGSSAAESSV